MLRSIKSLFTPPKSCVGTDKFGNKYFNVKDGNGIKRIVEFQNGELAPLSTIPTLWRSWLYNKREHPPSIQELELEEQKQKLFQDRIRAIKEADAKLRLQEMGEKEGKAQVVGGQNISDLLKQLKSQTGETKKVSLPEDNKKLE